MAKPHLLVFDLETTGLGQKGERVVPLQFAGVVIEPEFYSEVARMHAYLRPPQGAHFEAHAMSMHRKKGRGLEFYQTQGQSPENFYKQLAGVLAKFPGKVVPVCHNAKYDVPILERELALHGVTTNLDYHALCTAGMAYEKLVLRSGVLERVSLEPLCEHLGIPFDKNEAHDAMYDVLATVAVFRYFMSRQD